MLYERECRRSEALYAVARLALVQIPLLELTLMNVCMAIQTRSVLRVIIRSLAFRRMTLVAGDLCMFPHQRVSRLRVCSDGERRWLEPAHRVAANTIPAVGPPEELFGVLVRVTVGAAGAGYRNIEVGCLVARLAGQRGVASSQRISRAAVIKIR